MDYTSVSARVWKDQYDIIAKAAKSLGISIGEYVRSKIMPHAFKDSGMKPREFPPFVRGRPTPANQVAARLGIPRKQLEKAWIDRMATLALKEFTEEGDEDEEPDRRAGSDFRALTPPPKKRQTQ